ncbi:MAG TPA: alpha/beta fold hydrolase [Chloroflexota bacterium]|nr:alpha/beta fold hydrolase [Chloroflexota bacterium]
MGSAAPPPECFIHIPIGAGGGAPLLLALHGFGGSGKDFAQALLPLVDARGWLLVAPTFAYLDLVDPAETQLDDVTFAHDLRRIISEVGHSEGRALLFGFSRGASLAQRFAVFFPARVAAVACFAAGAYTLPQPSFKLGDSGASLPLSLPLGTSDFEQWFGHPPDAEGLRQVPFWIGVGEDDDDPLTVPSQYDALLGSTRLDRAKAFTKALHAFGARAELATFPDVAHELTPAAARAAIGFLERWCLPVP